MLRRPAFVILVLLAASLPLRAQAPHAEWRTLETEGFRVHYPAPWEEWARYAASRLEDVKDRVEENVGFETDDRIDVLVMDPIALANGSAWPFLGYPRMVLWTNPPPPESSIGANRDWIEVLTVHETAHLVHLLRPSRHPWRRLIMPLSPIVTGAPRWVIEGYATVIEGDLTGTGRPNSDFRASILRQWALEGRLPGYGQLASDSRSWMGMSMAYLAGSAYLEWLRERGGRDSLQHLWRRLTARQERTFAEAFEGVWGDDPESLYREFMVEVTGKAIAARDAARGSLREGELWQDLSWTTEPPDLTPDGERLVTVLRRRGEPSRLVILSTAPQDDKEEEARKKIEKMLERDPDDVAPVRSRPLQREPVFELETRDGAEPHSPKWMPDGKTVLFVRFEPDADGVFHPDLFTWAPHNSGVHRLTTLADLRQPDPSPDGQRAVAVRNRHGFSELVVVDLHSGEVTSISPPSITETWSSPAWSPDGSTIAAIRHEDGWWKLLLLDPAGGNRREIELPAGAIPAQPAWGDADTLFAAVGREGFLELQRFELGGSSATVVRPLGGAFAPAPAEGGSVLYYLDLRSEGLDLRRFDGAATTPSLPPLEVDRALAPVVRPPAPPTPSALAARDPGPDRPYGIGRQELRLLSGVNWLPSNQGWELGVRLGDVVGRLDTIAAVSLGREGSSEGWALASVWRGWPVALGAHLFSEEQIASDQPGCEEGFAACADGAAFDLQRDGVELSADWTRRWRTASIGLRGGMLSGSVEPEGEEALDTRSFWVVARPAWRRSFGKLKVGFDGGVQVENGETGDDGWSRQLLRAGGGIGWGASMLRYERAEGTADDVTAAWDRFALGGSESTILARSATFPRIVSPALPVGTAFGDRYHGDAFRWQGNLLSAFFERHRLWDDGAPRGEWIELAGVEARLRIAPFPLVRIPGMELRLGAAQMLSEPQEGEWMWWMGTVWRP